MMAEEKGTVPHSNVVMVTMDPYSHLNESIKVISLCSGKKCTVKVEFTFLAAIMHRMTSSCLFRVCCMV